MVIFSPWAFGTTQHWSIWTMNITAFGLGLLLLSKWIIRWSTGFRHWPSHVHKNEIGPKQHRLRLIHKTCTVLSAVLMILLLGYILTSAINARASFNLETHEYTYFEGINKSLPHSYDARGTWFLFWRYLGLIILFWSTRDWLAGAHSTRSSISLNPRLKRLLFLICLNGGALALECILQRIHYGDTGAKGKLLFLVEPLINHRNIAQFGPFAYRSNAASYLNLIWPIGLGLFIQLGRENLDHAKRRIGNGSELLLIPFIIVTASAPFISSARGGVFAMVGLLILTAVSMIFLEVRSKFLRLSVSMALFAGLGTAYYLGWDKLQPRLITDTWTNTNFNTFTSSGSSITSAINTTSGEQAASTLRSSFLVIAGKQYKVKANLTLKSGQVPLILLRNGNDTDWDIIANLSAGVNIIEYTASSTGVGAYIKYVNTLASNSSCTFEVKQIVEGAEYDVIGMTGGGWYGNIDMTSYRSQIFETTYKMIDEYGLFGSGPGSFEAVAQFELGETFTTWASWAHNDYLEFFLTFGKPGGLILIALAVILILQYSGTLFQGSPRAHKWFGLLAIIGVATHAIVDFPLQVYSILTLLTLIAAVILIYRPPMVASSDPARHHRLNPTYPGQREG